MHDIANKLCTLRVVTGEKNRKIKRDRESGRLMNGDDLKGD